MNSVALVQPTTSSISHKIETKCLRNGNIIIVNHRLKRAKLRNDETKYQTQFGIDSNENFVLLFSN